MCIPPRVTSTSHGAVHSTGRSTRRTSPPDQTANASKATPGEPPPPPDETFTSLLAVAQGSRPDDQRVAPAGRARLEVLRKRDPLMPRIATLFALVELGVLEQGAADEVVRHVVHGAEAAARRG